MQEAGLEEGWVMRVAKDQYRLCGIENRIRASLAAGLVMKRDEVLRHVPVPMDRRER